VKKEKLAELEKELVKGASTNENFNKIVEKYAEKVEKKYKYEDLIAEYFG